MFSCSRSINRPGWRDGAVRVGAVADMSYTGPKDLEGVGGWLRFLVVVLSILAPMFTLGQTASGISDTERMQPTIVALDAWRNIRMVLWAVALTQSAIFFAAGWRLANRLRPSTPRFAIACMWVGGPGMVIAGSALLNVVAGQSAAAKVDAMNSFWSSCVWAGIWTGYLIKSWRVENTYYVDRQGGEAANEARQPRLRWHFWRNWPRKRRRTAFFAATWVILVFVYALIFSVGTDGVFGTYYRRYWGTITLWAFCPPLLLLAGKWAYERFVNQAVN